MNNSELIDVIVNAVNQHSKLVEASIDRNGNLVLTAKQAGTSTGLRSTAISVDDTDYATGEFSKGESIKRVVAIGNEGDTFFQRWDAVKTTPRSTDDTNQVVEVASVMLESHINLDGRTDIERGNTNLVDIDWSTFGQLNNVYSQTDNFQSSIDYDASLNLDTYPTSITWTLPKASNADVDEWTHITLGSSLMLDGDKGEVQALRRFGNGIVAFQDKGISEILFNSRTQLSTQSGVPIEIGNSGKVEGKRYLSNKYGTTNKWSIVEGKTGLFFVDNFNKAFCSLGETVKDISAELGFSAWFRSTNTTEKWTPKSFDNIVSFYDKSLSDIYLVKKDSTAGEASSLVYNESLGAFSSFYDYGSMPMLVNVDDRLVSFRDKHLWLQNEGFYCNFFGKVYPYWASYRVSPSPYTDKIWTNLEFRADAYRVLDENGDKVNDDYNIIDGGDFGTVVGKYVENESFNTIKVWNEYQQTDNIAKSPVKKFRIWRYAIPRAVKTGTNKYGLDRIRNPWINLTLRKDLTETEEQQDLMQLHDVVIKYFE